MSERPTEIEPSMAGGAQEISKRRKRKKSLTRQAPTELLESLQDSPGVSGWGDRVHTLLTGFDEFVLFEDEGLLIVNKPAGIISQGAVDGSADMVDICRFVTGNTDVSPVNRLDKWTSGVMILGKDGTTRHDMGKQFADKTASGVRKTYKALLDGVFKDEKLVRAEVFVNDEKSNVKVVSPESPNAKRTLTEFTPITLYTSTKDNTLKLHTYTDVHLITGKRHQIRVVAARYLHMPIAGDHLYNRDHSGAPRQLLHSNTLGFTHPRTAEEMMIIAPIPPDFTKVMNNLEFFGHYQ